ncbi:MAG: hypothetical protein Q4A17_05805 [Thermoguttaceae bacterium]|nr:hypothetical protein [Thermoguttaceae bacterium]
MFFSRSRKFQVDSGKPLKRHTVGDLLFHILVAEVVQTLKNKDFEHHHDVVRQTPAEPSVLDLTDTI